MATVLRAADRSTQPWANGLGITSEVICWPPGSTIATCEWRVSVADMVGHSQFSALPGIDRTLVALAGDGIGLIVDGRAIELAAFDVARFSGDSLVSGGPLGRATQDLNLMVRRGVADADLEVFEAPGEQVLRARAGEQVLAWMAGEGSVDGTALSPGDAVLVDEFSGATVQCSGAVILIRVSRISDTEVANHHPFRSQ